MKILVLLLSSLIIALDQLFKFCVANNLKPNGNLTVIEGLLNFTYLENRGAAFGVLSDQRWLFILTTLLIIGFFVYIIFAKPINSKLFCFSAAFIIGGGIGNLIDRVFLGYVIDYIQLSFFPPVCNFADYCITAGTILLLIWIIFYYEKDNKKTKI